MLCSRWDSNPHEQAHTILSRARIPIPPLEHPRGPDRDRTGVNGFADHCLSHSATGPYFYFIIFFSNFKIFVCLIFLQFFVL